MERVFIDLPVNNAPHVVIQWIEMWGVRKLNVMAYVIMEIFRHPGLRYMSLV